ncbi:hypothetical protein LTS18_007966 [Coniosporium uncinatum]|uniref:Uncharacterized protein n=1 Tax=Coniosporium uncinatum TaxID=93489 RepID=A0ACC3DXJ6_9PEZI|nr:hypothetical protein LTS18_007966 [Coniosporium uncinatum]
MLSFSTVIAPWSAFLALVAILPGVTTAQTTTAATCSDTLTPSYAAPSVAPGYEARLVASGLYKPRGIIFDTSGNLLVVQQGGGITGLRLSDGGGACVSVAANATVVENANLTHGIEMSPDGRTLYASDSDAVYAWNYDAGTMETTSEPRTLVMNMSNSDHVTRTLLLSRKADGLMLVSRGSTENVDPLASDIMTGHSQIRAFNITNATQPYDYPNDGLRIGWGLRNSVGVAEDPATGNIYSVENSVDQLMRDDVDVHINNPGEEMNFHGTLVNNTYTGQGGNYGYPECYAAWDPAELPRNGSLSVGSQFAIGDAEATINDQTCAERIAPRLTFLAHMAPLDIKFNANGTTAWITFHGSWNRQPPSGYRLSAVQFEDGMPVAPANSTTAENIIMANADNNDCPRGCFRPVGLAWDAQGRLFMSSDSTGEIYVITRTDGSNTEDATPSNTGGSPAPSPSPTTGAAPVHRGGIGRAVLGAAVLPALAMFL